MCHKDAYHDCNNYFDDDGWWILLIIFGIFWVLCVWWWATEREVDKTPSYARQNLWRSEVVHPPGQVVVVPDTAKKITIERAKI